MARFWSLIAAVALLLAPAALLDRPERAAGALNLTGQLDRAPYEIRVPKSWNRTLVLYAHGYRDAPDHPGEPDERSASAFLHDRVEELLLDRGYAVAGSAYSANGWAVDEGSTDTSRLAEHFRSEVGAPRTTLLAGFSMGSLIAFTGVERADSGYDGALAVCAMGAGASRTVDSMLVLALGYDAVFGWPSAWGTPHDLRDDLDFESEVLPELTRRMTEPGGAAKLELVQLAAGIPKGPEWPTRVWRLATEGRAELERRAGGSVVQNADHDYVLSIADRGYLARLGIPRATVDATLATMQARRLPAGPGRAYVQKFADPTGRIARPVLTLGTGVDALVPPAGVAAYADTVAAAGATSWLASAWTNGVGHCSFTPQQLATSVDALRTWVTTGRKPTRFPADQGFITFTAPRWRQP